MVVFYFTYVDYERMHLMLSNFLIFRDGSEWSVQSKVSWVRVGN